MAKGPAVANFAAKMPANSGALVPLDNDELSKAINSIRYVFGSMDVTADAAVMDMSARTGQEAEARSLLETMQGLQMVGKALLGSSKKPENAIFVRLIDGLKMSQTTTDVNLTLSIQQADINTLVGMIK